MGHTDLSSKGVDVKQFACVFSVERVRKIVTHPSKLATVSILSSYLDTNFTNQENINAILLFKIEATMRKIHT